MMPIVGFIDADDPRMLMTLDAIERDLTDERGLVYRYRAADGLPGEEGSFLLCTFWLAHAQALAGRVADARATFERAVAYANDVKEKVLGVSAEVLRAHGAVSSECAIAMAEGARRVLGVDIACATTCIAGPGGATPEKPVGLVFAAVATPGGSRAHERKWGGERAQVQLLASYIALQLVLDACR